MRIGEKAVKSAYMRVLSCSFTGLNPCLGFTTHSLPCHSPKTNSYETFEKPVKSSKS